MSDVKHDPGCPLATWRDITHGGITGGMGAPRPECSCERGKRPMSVKHEHYCNLSCMTWVNQGEVSAKCTCGAERIAELEALIESFDRELAEEDAMCELLKEESRGLEARVRDLEAKLTHLRNLLANHEGKATMLIEEIRRGLEEP